MVHGYYKQDSKYAVERMAEHRTVCSSSLSLINAYNSVETGFLKVLGLVAIPIIIMQFL